MPRVEERRALGKEKWLEHYRIHRRALITDRLAKVKKYMQMFEDHPTTETNIGERVRALSWWQYFMRICALYIYKDRTELVGMFKGEEYESLPFEQKAARVEKMAKLFKERTEEHLKEFGDPDYT